MAHPKVDQYKSNIHLLNYNLYLSLINIKHSCLIHQCNFLDTPWQRAEAYRIILFIGFFLHTVYYFVVCNAFQIIQYLLADISKSDM